MLPTVDNRATDVAVVTETRLIRIDRMCAVAAREYHIRFTSARAVIEIVIGAPAVNCTGPDWWTPAVVLLPMLPLTFTRVGLTL